MKMIKKGLGLFSILLCASSLFAQDDVVKFGAISRGVLQESTLGDADTTNPNRNNSGQAVVDLRVNINPNRKTEIGTVIRMESELGGFYGAGSDISLRQLYVKGLLYDVVSYEVGDIYLELSPYTLYNTSGELAQHEAQVFHQLRTDLSEYDNFNIGNAWWSQGGHINTGLAFDSTGTTGVQFDVFTTRLEAPSTTRFLAGGRAALYNKNKYNIKLNAVRTFDAKKVNPLEESMYNTVASLEWEYQLLPSLTFFGETGLSQYAIEKPHDIEGDYLVPEDRNGEFINAGLGWKALEGQLNTRLKYLRNSAFFYSVGAQSKRLDYTASPALFLNVANDPFNNRSLNIYDLIANQNVYNAQISGTLMTYDPLYGNALAYGEATPNRQGLMFSTTYQDSAKVITAGIDAALLNDVTGVGTEEKRSFTRIGAHTDLDIASLIGYKKNFTLGGAYTYESTQRDGNLSSIDLKTSSLEAGLEFEVFKKLYLLGGIKTLQGKGNEFLYDLSNQNVYDIPTEYTVNINQTLTGVGARYQFSDNTYLSIKNFGVNIKDLDDDNRSYAFNQWMLFFSLKL